MGKAPCLCLCYVSNFFDVLKEMFVKNYSKKELFLVQCHMCHQNAKTFHFCFFMFNITMFHFLFVRPLNFFFNLLQNFSLFAFFFNVVYYILIVLVKKKNLFPLLF
jgi:hypothetical protein